MKIKFVFKYLICDKPAKSMRLNVQAHSAKYFCPQCLSISKVDTINEKKYQFVPLNCFLIKD